MSAAVADRERTQPVQLLQGITAAVSEGLLLVDRASNRVLECNEQLSEMIDLPCKDCTGAESFWEHFGRCVEDAPALDRFLARAVCMPESSGLEIHRTKGDAFRVLEIYTAPVRDDEGRPFARLWSFRDLTRQRELEAQFQQAQKMDALGRLAGGIAHDFNNVLTVISGNLQLLEDDAGDGEEREFVQSALQATFRAGGLVRQLLDFSRQRPHQRSRQDANQLAGEVALMMSRTLDRRIEVRTELDPEAGPVMMDANQVHQVLMNLCVNASDAMPEGGLLSLGSSCIQLGSEEVAKVEGARPGAYLALTVADTGTGISEAVRARMFEPFFTTKEEGKGTGLGLATSYGIARQHGGWLACDSIPGAGTTFTLYLPCDAGTAEAVRKPAGRPVGGTESILLVEDEDMVRELTEQSLRRFGYQPLSARNGQEALDLLEDHAGTCRLVLLDLNMPGLSGRDTLKAINRRHPDLPVIVVTGENLQRDDFEAGADPVAGFVAKPFELHELTTAMRRILDESGC